jgi:hypothetical protein
MLHPFDDYPVHQVGQPLLTTAVAIPNSFDRYFFNGYSSDAEVFFALAFGLYPGRDVIDAGFSVVRQGEQMCTLASGRMPADRTTRVGPIRIEVIEPMRVLRVVVDDSNGLAADLVFTARTVAIEEPPFREITTAQATTDYTRFTQFGSWSGTLVVDGETIVVDETWRGCRDRSWGVRNVGERLPGAPARTLPDAVWVWTPVNFDDVCTHMDYMGFTDGRERHSSGFIAPVGGDLSALRTMATISHDVKWRSGTRWAESATITLTALDGTSEEVRLETLVRFQMGGIGYFDPERAHGTWQGEESVVGRRFRTAEVDPASPANFHVQNLCRATWGNRTGLGVLEHIVVGPYAAGGFTGMTDGAP